MTKRDAVPKQMTPWARNLGGWGATGCFDAVPESTCSAGAVFHSSPARTASATGCLWQCLQAASLPLPLRSTRAPVSLPNVAEAPPERYFPLALVMVADRRGTADELDADEGIGSSYAESSSVAAVDETDGRRERAGRGAVAPRGASGTPLTPVALVASLAPAAVQKTAIGSVAVGAASAGMPTPAAVSVELQGVADDDDHEIQVDGPGVEKAPTVMGGRSPTEDADADDGSSIDGTGQGCQRPRCVLCPAPKVGSGRFLPSDILGPFTSSSGRSDVHVHEVCATWAPEVYWQRKTKQLANLYKAFIRGRRLSCCACGERGATVGCCIESCMEVYRYVCLATAGCSVRMSTYMAFCQ